MTREELIQITHKLGYDYVWQDSYGTWFASADRPTFFHESWFMFEYAYKYIFEVFVNVEYCGTITDSLLCYIDTLCQNKEEEVKEVESRG
jgi:hypothetical protein